MNSLETKNIVITGASSGIGRQIAIEASNHGANIVLIARNAIRLNETFSSLKRGNHIVFSADITDFTRLEQIISESVSKIGKISGFVHSAGIEMTLPLRNMKPEHYDKLFRTNVISSLEFARILSKKVNLNEKGASFVFISSIMGNLGKEGKIGYCASKAALTSSVKAMALELSARKIRCNSILPGVVKTTLIDNMFNSLPESAVSEIIKEHPLGLGEPEDIANLVIFLLSDKARWITGSEFIIDGGYSAK